MLGATLHTFYMDILRGLIQFANFACPSHLPKFRILLETRAMEPEKCLLPAPASSDPCSTEQTPMIKEYSNQQNAPFIKPRFESRYLVKTSRPKKPRFCPLACLPQLIASRQSPSGRDQTPDAMIRRPMAEALDRRPPVLTPTSNAKISH